MSDSSEIDLDHDDAVAIAVAARIATGGPPLTVRFLEKVTESNSHLTKELVLSLDLTPYSDILKETSRSCILPLLAFDRQRRLLDQLELTVQGAPLTVVPREHARHLTIGCLTTVWERTVGVDQSGLDDLRSAIIAREPGEDVAAALSKKTVALDEVARRGPQLTPDRLAVLASAVRFLNAHYLLWVVLPSGVPDRIEVRLRFRQPYKAKGTLAIKGANAVRGFLGLYPYTFELELEADTLGGSYHFLFEAPPGHYVAYSGFAISERSAVRDYCWKGATFARKQEAWPHTLDMHRRLARLEARYQEFGPYANGEERARLLGFHDWAMGENVPYEGWQASAKPYAHLYVHGPRTTLPAGCRAVVSFRELPPGSIGRAGWITAALVTILLGVVVNYQNIAHSSYVVAAAALMLTAPAAAAALAGNAFGGDDVLRAPMLARFAFQWAAVASVVTGSHLIAVALPSLVAEKPSGWRKDMFGWLLSPSIPFGALVVTLGILAWLVGRRLVQHELWHFPRRGRTHGSIIDLPSTSLLLGRLTGKIESYTPPGLRSYDLPEIDDEAASRWLREYVYNLVRRASSKEERDDMMKLVNEGGKDATR